MIAEALTPGRGGVLLCLPEEKVHSSARTQAECVIEIPRLRLAQGHINAFPNLLQFSFRERICSKIGNEPIQFCIRDNRRN
jgi:hypothetical protein